MNGAVPHAWLRRVSDYCSGGVSATERAAVEAHLATCAECRRALATYRRFDALTLSPLRLGDGAVGALPGYRPAMQEETMITSDSDRETGTTTIRPRRPRAALTTLGAIAAVVLVAVLAGALFALHRAPSGPANPRNTSPFVHVVSASRQVLAGDAAPTVATCPAGEVALSGGWAVPAAGSVLASRRMGNGWAVVVRAPAGSGVPVTASVACLARVPGASVQEVSSTITVASGALGTNYVDCPAASDLVVGGGLANSSPQMYLGGYHISSSPHAWDVGNSGPTAATNSVYAECLAAPGVSLLPASAHGITIPPGSEQTITAQCPRGSFASGGGFAFGAPQAVRILGLAPASQARGWSADLSAVGGTTTVDVDVACLSFT